MARTWTDLYVGDYWSAPDGVIYRIADIDFWRGKGDTACDTPHIVVVPDGALYSASMNTTTTSNGGYYGSTLRQTNFAQAKTKIESFFGAASILKHREKLTTATTNGVPSAVNWYDSEIELMNEIMVFGTRNCSIPGTGTTIPTNHTVDNTQLALFRLAPYYIYTKPYRTNYWLRDIGSTSSFALVSDQGDSSHAGAHYSNGVRPAFGIIGAPQAADEPMDGPEIMGE